jgi:ergothioneine biosynthesis protein EgtB
MEKVASAIGLERYKAIRDQTLNLCAPLKTEDYVVQPVIDVSPPKWHLAHTTWFFETFILKKFSGDYKEFDPSFSYLFNSYYESVGERVDRVNRGNLTRPTVQEVMAYRAYVDAAMEEVYESEKLQDRAQFNRLLEIGLNHEQQHQELLVTDIKYILGHNPLRPRYKEIARHEKKSNAPPLKYIPFEGGLTEIGYAGAGFSWDNEKPVHQVFLGPFGLANRLITCGEYLEFMNDGAYRDFRHWLSDGWAEVQAKKWEAPMYWFQEDDQWFEYRLGGVQPIEKDAPVTHISFYEADAFATWAGKRLPTEFEWEMAAKTQKHIKGNFVESGNLHPAPSHNGPDALQQLNGDCWEWTYSGYFPYPGYKREEGALGEYNGKFMINQMVLRGGSCATPEDHYRVSYRNFFQPELRWQFTGIRLAE